MTQKQFRHPPDLPILGPLTAGTTQRHLVTLPGAALADEPRPAVTVTGAKPGPVLFVNAGVHGGEYPAIEAVIRLGKTLEPDKIAGTVILMPVLNLPAFRTRTPFLCPVDNVNPNRVFPGDPEGSYSEQMTHALINEFVVHADAYLDLHGGDIPEALVPFCICRRGAGRAVAGAETGQAIDPVDAKSKEVAVAFGLPYVLTVSRPIQAAKGSSSYVAAAERGIPAVLAEAGGVGQLQEDAVKLLVDGVHRVMAHMGMFEDPDLPPTLGSGAGSSPLPSPLVSLTGAARPSLPVGEKKGEEGKSSQPMMLTAFEWVYAKQGGMFYSRVAVGSLVEKGQELGTIGSLFGDDLETVVSPVSGVILFLTVNPAILANGLLMGIGIAGEGDT